MPSVACVFSLVLSSQAFFCAFGAQVLHQSRVAVVVSASAQTDEIDMPEMSSDEVLEMKVQGMLSDVEDMVRAGATPEPDKIRTIKSIVADELVPDLQATRDSAAKQVGVNLAAIDTCNSNAVSRLQDIKATTEVAVGQARTEHATCREGEKGKNSTKGSKCAELDNFLNAIMVPADIPTGRPRDPMVQYVQTMSQYFCPKGPTCTTLDEACKLAEKEHAKHKGNCDRLQAQFEMGFCTWRTELNDACVALSECYQSAVKLYSDHVSDTKELVKKWKVEYAALKKILCYVDVWLSDNDVKTADAGQLNKCNGSSVDTSPMDVDFGTPAAQVECSMAAVEKHPGTPEFVTVEYANFRDYVVAVIPCLPCGGTTTGSATAGPVTTTAAPEKETLPTEQECGDLTGNSCPGLTGWHDSIDLASWAEKSWDITMMCIAKATKTSQTTCSDWCHKAGYDCLRAQDDVGVSEKCPLNNNKGAHERQTTKDNGCHQKWQTQVCQCGRMKKHEAMAVAVSGSYNGDKTGHSGGLTGQKLDKCLSGDTVEFDNPNPSGISNSAKLAMGTVCCDSSGKGSRPGCKKGDFYEAKLHCESKGLRLCTADELKAGAGEASGCHFDGTLVWSSSSCA